MKIKYLFFFCYIFSIVFIAQAQQTEFQGTWIGERNDRVDRSAYKIVITDNKWQQFFNDQIEAEGTARFSAGRAELFLADGRIYWDLRLLAHGLIEHESIRIRTGLYRFRHVQSSYQQQENTSHRRAEALKNQAIVELKYNTDEHIIKRLDRESVVDEYMNYNRIIYDLNEVIMINPNDAEAYYLRGYAKFKHHRNFAYVAGIPEDIINDFTQAIRINSNFIYAYILRGYSYFSNEDYIRAIADYTQVISLDPNFADAYEIRGLAYLDSDKYDQAISDFEKAIQINPNLSESRIGLERARLLRGR